MRAPMTEEEVRTSSGHSNAKFQGPRRQTSKQMSHKLLLKGQVMNVLRTHELVPFLSPRLEIIQLRWHYDEQLHGVYRLHGRQLETKGLHEKCNLDLFKKIDRRMNERRR